LALFFTGCLWIFAASSAASQAAQGIANRLNLPVVEDPLQQAFFLFLLLCGFSAIRWIGTRRGGIRVANSLPQRATAQQEWLRGAALGWGVLLVAVLPMMLAGSLHPSFFADLRSFGVLVVSFIALAISTLALEVAFRGYIFGRLIDAIGPAGATILLSLIYAVLSSYHPNSTSLSVLVTFVLGVFYSLAYLRTHALWLGWGLHFGWAVATAVLFGLPIGGYATYNSLIVTTVSGPAWLSGGPYGPEGAALTVLILIGAMFALYRVTRDYAWEYTHPPIVAAGYPMDIAPPAAHAAMEAAAPPAPLVQILGATPTSSSTLPLIDEHLRRDSKTTLD
jgi:membrane protease YdiL (CAAX protease family)